MLDLFKANFVLIICLVSGLHLIKFLISSFLEMKKMRILNKDVFKISKCLTELTVEVQSSDFNVKDLVSSVNSNKLAENYSDFHDIHRKTS